MPDAALAMPTGSFLVIGLQAGLVLLGIIAIYLLCYAVRDILLRSKSLPLQIGCIVLVAALPVAGFLVYLLIRPARTVKERELEAMLRTLVGNS